MSSGQGANATTITTGYTYNENVVRDASDWTRQLKERRAYYAYFAQANGNKDTGSDPWFKYGIQFGYTYLFGRFKCGSCDGGAFNSLPVGGS